jgi:hypothetical protein
VDRLLNQNKDSKFGHDTINNKILNSSSMFLTSITEDEVLNVTSKQMVNFQQAMMKYLKASIQFIKKNTKLYI